MRLYGCVGIFSEKNKKECPWKYPNYNISDANSGFFCIPSDFCICRKIRTHTIMYRLLFWRKPGSKKNIEDYWGIQRCSQKHRVLQVIQWKVYIDNETFLWGSLFVEPLGEEIWRFVFQAVYIVLWRLGHVQWCKREKRALFRDSGISLIDYETDTSVSLWVTSSFISVFFGIN